MACGLEELAAQGGSGTRGRRVLLLLRAWQGPLEVCSPFCQPELIPEAEDLRVIVLT